MNPRKSQRRSRRKRRSRMSPMNRRTAATLILIFAGQIASGEVVEKSKNISGVSVHYKVILPKSYDPSKAYPAVLAFPGGPQTMATVDNAIARNWRDEAE